MLSSDLADLYGVEARALIQAVKRDRERFPADFMFQLTKRESADLKSQSVISSWGGAGYTLRVCRIVGRMGERGDSNPRPRGPQPRALTN